MDFTESIYIIILLYLYSINHTLLRKTLRRMSFIAFLKIFFSDLRNCCVGILLIVKYKRCDQWTKNSEPLCQTLRWGFSSHFLHSGNWRLKEFFSPFCYFAYQVTSVENIELVQADILPGKSYQTPWLHLHINQFTPFLFCVSPFAYKGGFTIIDE